MTTEADEKILCRVCQQVKLNPDGKTTCGSCEVISSAFTGQSEGEIREIARTFLLWSRTDRQSFSEGLRIFIAAVKEKGLREVKQEITRKAQAETSPKITPGVCVCGVKVDRGYFCPTCKAWADKLRENNLSKIEDERICLLVLWQSRETFLRIKSDPGKSRKMAGDIFKRIYLPKIIGEITSLPAIPLIPKPPTASGPPSRSGPSLQPCPVDLCGRATASGGLCTTCQPLFNELYCLTHWEEKDDLIAGLKVLYGFFGLNSEMTWGDFLELYKSQIFTALETKGLEAVQKELRRKKVGIKSAAEPPEPLPRPLPEPHRPNDGRVMKNGICQPCERKGKTMNENTPNGQDRRGALIAWRLNVKKAYPDTNKMSEVDWEKLFQQREEYIAEQVAAGTRPLAAARGFTAQKLPKILSARFALKGKKNNGSSPETISEDEGGDITGRISALNQELAGALDELEETKVRVQNLTAKLAELAGRL